VWSRAKSDESGIGLIEIVVSMFLLAILAVAVLPVLTAGLKTSASSADQATASQLAGSAIEHARSRAPKCSDLAAYIAASPETTTSRSKVLTASVATVDTAFTCPTATTSYPLTVALTVRVSDATGKAYTTASARVLLTQP